MADVKINDLSRLARVNFTNRGISKVLSSQDSLSDATPDKQTIFSISEILSKAKIQKEKATGVTSIPDFLGVEYVGYIIEKERLDRDSGEWILIDQYKIIGAEASSFKDTRVAYGEFYRYRIKSILKLTVRETKIVDVQTVQNIRAIENKIKADNLARNQSILENVQKVMNLGIKSKTSAGKKTKDIVLSEDTTIRMSDNAVNIVKNIVKGATDTIPNKAKLANPDLTNKQLQALLNAGLIDRLPKTRVEYTSYYFESDPSRNWVYFECSESVPPPPPATIKISPNTPSQSIGIYWLKPGNSQRDISEYKVYRREKVGDEWELLATLPEDVNVFVDKDISIESKYVYALSCVDVHGIESFLSTQIEARLNPQFGLEKQERKLRWIGGSGAKLSETKAVFKKFHTLREQIIAKSTLTMKVNKKFNDTVKNIIVRITSLDTHQQTELKVVLKNVNTKGIE